MATESTAIVNLLDLVKNQKPLERDSSDDLLFGGRVRFDPMAMPAPAQPIMLPLPQPFVRQPAAAIEQKTHRMPRVAAASFDPKKLALPVVLFVCAMVLLSVYLAKGSKHAETKATTIVHAPPAVRVEAPAPVVEAPAPAPEAPAPAPAPEAAAAAAVATPIDQPSQPTVTEIPQPTITEIVPTVPTVPADVQPVARDEAEAPAEDAKPVAKSSKRKHHHREHRAAKRAKTETRVATAEQSKPAKLEKLGGKGALQVSSSPARELWVDGKNTKQMTPQKVKLAPGTHNITLFDKKTRSAKTFQVEIKANETLRVSKSY